MRTKKINVLCFAYNSCKIRTANIQFIVHGKLSVLVNVDLCENTSNNGDSVRDLYSDIYIPIFSLHICIVQS